MEQFKKQALKKVAKEMKTDRSKKSRSDKTQTKMSLNSDRKKTSEVDVDSNEE